MPPPDLAAAATDLGRALTDERTARGRWRLVQALVGWLPIVLGLDWLVGEMTGCGRFAASCTGAQSLITPLLALAVLALLLLVPMLASIAATAAVAARRRRHPDRAGALGERCGVRGGAARGVPRLRPARGVGSGRGVRDRPACPAEVDAVGLSAPSRILRACHHVTTRRRCPRLPSNISSRCASLAGSPTRRGSRHGGADRPPPRGHHPGGQRDVPAPRWPTVSSRMPTDASSISPMRVARPPTGSSGATPCCEWLLTTVIGLGWAESDDEAMRLQGAISPRVEARLDEMLGHPETCPHGNPIDAETARRRPAGTKLSEIGAGERATVFRITEEAEEDAGLLSYLEARALMPGRPHHGAGPLRIAGLADARRAARAGDARPPPGVPGPRAARRSRSGPLPHGPRRHRPVRAVVMPSMPR